MGGGGRKRLSAHTHITSAREIEMICCIILKMGLIITGVTLNSYTQQ